MAPVPQRDTRILEYCANLYRVLLTAVPALPEIALIALAVTALHLVNVHSAAVWATEGIAPSLSFEEIHGCVFTRASLWNVLYYVVGLLLHVGNCIPTLYLNQVKY